MSDWTEQIKNSLIITTGDGIRYEFKLWIEASQEIEWNYSEFDYINISGTNFDKRNVRGRKFPLRFFYQGLNHTEQSERFRLSLNDQRFCIMDHPYYGLVNIQILSLKINNTELNVSEFTGTAFETITNTSQPNEVPAFEYIELKKIQLDSLSESELNVTPNITEVNTLKMTVSQNYSAGTKIVTVPDEVTDYFNAFSDASNAIDVMIASPLLAIRTTVAVLTLPAKFTATVKARIGLLLSQFNYLRRILPSIGPRVSAKQLYEIQGLSLISSMAIAAINPNRTGNERDYTNANSVIEIIEIIKGTYTQFLADLDSLQGLNGGNPSYYFPGQEAMIVFDEIISTTLANLIDIALNGKREISVVLTEDSNIILLTDKYYGIASAENTLTFVNNNGLTWRDTLIIKKGREIFYYI